MPAGLGHLPLQNRAVTRQDAADLRRFLSQRTPIGGVNRSRYAHLRMVTRPPFLVISLECGARQSPVHWLVKV